MKITSRTLLVTLLGATSTTTVLAQIPDFLTVDFAENAGNQELEVVYGANKLQDGEKMSVEAVQELPSFKLCDSCGIAPSTNYIIMLLDVDTSPNPETSQTLHYLRTDFGADQGGTGLVSTEPALIPFEPPNPEEGSGPHRYVWLLFHQKRNITNDGITGVPSEDERGNFDVLAWLDQNDGINSPDSGVHFVAEFGVEGDQTIAPSSSTRPGVSPTRSTTAPTETGTDGDGDEDDGGDNTPTGTPVPTEDSDSTPSTTGLNPGETDTTEADGAASGLRSGWVAGAFVVVASLFAAW